MVCIPKGKVGLAPSTRRISCRQKKTIQFVAKLALNNFRANLPSSQPANRVGANA